MVPFRAPLTSRGGTSRQKKKKAKYSAPAKAANPSTSSGASTHDVDAVHEVGAETVRALKKAIKPGIKDDDFSRESLDAYCTTLAARQP